MQAWEPFEHATNASEGVPILPAAILSYHHLPFLAHEESLGIQHARNNGLISWRLDSRRSPILRGLIAESSLLCSGISIR